MPRSSKQYLKALSYVESLLRSTPATAHARLPTIAAMARAAGVAGATMAKAVTSLCEKGRLVAKPGAGIYRALPASVRHTPPAPTPPSRARWRSAAEQIETDLLYGRLSDTSTLPSVKELQARCGVSYRTLRKALEYLVRRGVLSAESGRYRPTASAAGATGTIVLVARGNRSGRLSVQTPYTQDLLRSLERACGRRSATLAVTTCYYEGHTLVSSARVRHAIVNAAGTSSLLGFVFITMGLTARPGYVREVLEMLTGFDVPVAVQVDGTTPDLVTRTGRHPVRTFNLGSETDAGSAVGRYLLRLGHRRIAYISAVHGHAWSQTRLDGLHRSFESEPDTSVFAAVIDSAGLPESANVLPRDIRRSVGSFLPAGASPGDVSDREFDVILAAARQVSRSRHLREALTPLAESCLQREGISAWVTANDEHALHCLALLEHRRVAVPRDLSVVGFDDSLDALDRQLTSYCFDVRTLGRAMVDHVLGSLPESLQRHGLAPVEIEGFLTVRRTSGPHHAHSAAEPMREVRPRRHPGKRLS